MDLHATGHCIREICGCITDLIFLFGFFPVDSCGNFLYSQELVSGLGQKIDPIFFVERRRKKASRNSVGDGLPRSIIAFRPLVTDGSVDHLRGPPEVKSLPFFGTLSRSSYQTRLSCPIKARLIGPLIYLIGKKHTMRKG